MPGTDSKHSENVILFISLSPSFFFPSLSSPVLFAWLTEFLSLIFLVEWAHPVQELVLPNLLSTSVCRESTSHYDPVQPWTSVWFRGSSVSDGGVEAWMFPLTWYVSGSYCFYLKGFHVPSDLETRLSLGAVWTSHYFCWGTLSVPNRGSVINSLVWWWRMEALESESPESFVI